MPATARWSSNATFTARVPGGTGACHAGGEELVNSETLAALLPQSGGVGSGELLRIGNALLALVGFGEDQGDRLFRPAAFGVVV